MVVPPRYFGPEVRPFIKPHQVVKEHLWIDTRTTVMWTERWCHGQGVLDFYGPTTGQPLEISCCRNRVKPKQTLLGRFQRKLQGYTRTIDSGDLKAARAISPCPAHVVANHDHGAACGLRFAAMNTFEAYSQQVGRPVTAISSSQREEKMGWYGQRRLYGTRDLSLACSDTVIPDHHLVAMIDVDYYVSRQQMGNYAGRTMMLYTVQPRSVAGADGDSKFFMQPGGLYTEAVAGGGSYSHYLWDYGRDWVTIEESSLWWRPSTWFPAWWVYDVHRKVLGGPAHSRCLVWLVPRVRITLPSYLMNFLAKFLMEKDTVAIQPRPLERITEAITGSSGVVYGHFESGQEAVVSMRMDEPFTKSVTVPVGVFAHIKRAVNTKTPGVTTVQRVCEDHGLKLDTAQYSTLAAGACFKPDCKIYVNYTNCSDPGKTTVKLGAVPIVQPATAVTECDGNVQHSKAERFTKIANTVVPPPAYEQWAKEFGEFVFPEVVGPLADFADAEAQVSKTRVQLARTVDLEKSELPTKAGARIFLKAEANAGARQGKKAARMIYTMGQADQVQGTRVMLTVKERLKTLTWFMVGLEPSKLADGVCDFVRLFEEVCATDFSKMDATISLWIRTTYVNWLVRAFPPEEREEVRAIMAKFCNIKITFGSTTAKSGGINLSGAPDTTCLNTLVNAFVDYCALRKKGYSPEEAWAAIGPKYGDDGLSSPDVAATVAEVAAEIGMVIKADVSKKHEPVMFLSRVYPDAWRTNTSFAEVKRALSKIPVIPESKPLKEGLADKVAGYLVTDSKCPVLGDYLHALRRTYQLDMVDLGDLSADMARRAEGGPYPFNDEDYDLCLGVIEEALGLRAGDGNLLVQTLRTAWTPEDLERCMMFEPDVDISNGVA